jgi:hypothetical protein
MRKNEAAVSHTNREVAELRSDRELAVEYLKATMESLDHSDDRAAPVYLRYAQWRKRMVVLKRLPLKLGSTANRFTRYPLYKGASTT